MFDVPCSYCGFPASSVLDTEGNFSCVNCQQKWNTCLFCKQASKCEFETNPSPLPKQVQKTMRQGNMVIQQVVKNPDRIKEFCLYSCPCFDEEYNICLRETDGYCAKYNEIEGHKNEN